jgi:hypothetical protein
MSASPTASVDLSWIPLGAGAHVVRLSGKVFEAVDATVHRRPRRDLYHSALQVAVEGDRYIIEMTPVPDGEGSRRGVVVEGPVGTRLAGHLRLFRYEVRRWRDGVIPDLAYAIGDPTRVSADPDRASELLDLVPSVPPLVWGRDELRTGDMWNSNSLTSWLLVRSGIDTSGLRPPTRGRAPGWRAGLVIGVRGHGAR